MSLVRFTKQMPSVFDRFFDGDLMDWSNDVNTTLPSVNIKETKEGFEVKVAAPGFDKNDFKLELNHDVLTISSEKQAENGEYPYFAGIYHYGKERHDKKSGQNRHQYPCRDSGE